MFGTITIDKWKEAQHFTLALSQLPSQWIFRGQGDATWELSTSLQRAAEDYKVANDLLPQIKRKILDDFKRTAHHFLRHPPKDNEVVDWVSILQHHGGITRLLDFTYSFYMAIYFAIESAFTDACVWCLNKHTLKRNLIASFRNKKNGALGISAINAERDINTYDGRNIAAKCIRNEGVTTHFVMPVKPYRFTERMAIQQGIFLLPSDIVSNFHAILCKSLNLCTIEPEAIENISTLNKYNIIKLVIPLKSQQDILWDLRNMNITSASLFPGLDGYARSLKDHLIFVDKIESDMFWDW
ncbi:MAG: FRG domain-containing protein [Syntrophobacteraceae bacterium]